jgi:hypothetical protein
MCSCRHEISTSESFGSSRKRCASAAESPMLDSSGSPSAALSGSSVSRGRLLFGLSAAA